MEVLTIIQTTVIFVVYMSMTCVLPFIILNPLLKRFRLCEKLIMSIVFGNFYIINEVLILQLLHISNCFTLILFIAVPAYFALSRVYGFSGKAYIINCWDKFMKLIKKELGFKSLIFSALRKIGRCIVKVLKKCLRVIKRNPIDAVLFLAVTLLITYIYGGNLILNYGYGASDIPIHNYWINSLSRGNLFADGVYPFGFHCVIYFMHAAFGLETYVILRVFCFIQTLVIHWSLLFFLKACLKTRYIGYLGTAAYVGLDILHEDTYSRFCATLPQEFGMIFILPAIYFGFAFFKYKKEELQTEKLNGGNPAEAVLSDSELETSAGELYCVRLKLFRKIKAWFSDLTRSKWCLIGFAMSFSLTLAVHFYGTMVAGIFCVAMAIGFFFRFFRKKYFWNVVVTCAISVMIAVLPMAAAYAAGTPLQGSLNWGMSIMSSSDTQEDITADAFDAAGTIDINIDVNDNNVEGEETAVNENTAESGAVSENINAAPQNPTSNARKTGIFGKLLRLVRDYDNSYNTIREVMNIYIAKNHNHYVAYSVFISIAGLVIAALLLFILRDSDYAAQLLSVSIFIICMSIILCSLWFGLPRLMDSSRCSIYLCYALPVLWSYAADAVLVLTFRWFKKAFIGNAVSLIIIGAAVLLAVNNNIVRAPRNNGALETNGAITCLSNIVYGHDDWSWTICSANDELRMCEDYGFHYETIDLLRKIENIGRHSGMTIPTKYIYFFVEKIPINYYGTYDGAGQSVSEAGAMEQLPYSSGLTQYMTRNRWIVMSRMYYWAEEFMRLHPDSMSVYYESDEFICYELIQNVDSLFELGIDYGYNNFDYNN